MVWINIPKPTESSIATVGGGGGEPIGLLLALTYAGVSSSSIITGWTEIPKPTVSSWVSIAKPLT